MGNLQTPSHLEEVLSPNMMDSVHIKKQHCNCYQWKYKDRWIWNVGEDELQRLSCLMNSSNSHIFDNHWKSRHCKLTARISWWDVSSAPRSLLSVSFQSSQNIFHMASFCVASLPTGSIAGWYGSCFSFYTCFLPYNKVCYFLLG